MSGRSFTLGVDPSKKKLDVALVTVEGERVELEPSWPMSREGFEALRGALEGRLEAGDQLVVGVEATAALDDNFLVWLQAWRAPFEVVVLRLNPAQRAKFVGPKPIRGKTDAVDARWRIAEFTRVYAAQLHAFVHDEEAQAMQRLVHERQWLGQEAAAVKNRLQDRLVICFPEFASVFAQPCGPLAQAVLGRAPTARHAAAARESVLAAVRARRGGPPCGPQRARCLRQAARQSIASATADTDAEAIRFLLTQLQQIQDRQQALEAHLEAYARRLQDPAPAAQAPAPDEPPAPAPIPEQLRLLDSIRGVDIVGAATVVLRSGGLGRFTSAKAFAAQLGACPDRIQTGSSRDSSRLTSCGDRRTRCILYMTAQAACNFDPVFAFHKWRLIRSGRKPKQAVCAAMHRMARLMFALVRTRRTYDVNRALEQVVIHHRKLWITFLAHAQNNRKLWKGVDEKWRKIA